MKTLLIALSCLMLFASCDNDDKQPVNSLTNQDNRETIQEPKVPSVVKAELQAGVVQVYLDDGSTVYLDETEVGHISEMKLTNSMMVLLTEDQHAFIYNLKSWKPEHKKIALGQRNEIKGSYLATISSRHGYHEIRVYNQWGNEVAKDLSEVEPELVFNQSGDELAYMFKLVGARSRKIQRNGHDLDKSISSRLSRYVLENGELVGMLNPEISLEARSASPCEAFPEGYLGRRNASACLYMISYDPNTQQEQNIADLLTLFDADPNFKRSLLYDAGNQDNTLARAVDSGSLLRLRMLLFYGADPNMPVQQHAAVRIAKNQLDGSFLELLKAYHFNFKSKMAVVGLHYASFYGSLESVKKYVEYGTNLNLGASLLIHDNGSRDFDYSPNYRDRNIHPLSLAIALDHFEIANYLLENGATGINRPFYNKAGYSCGHYAVDRASMDWLNLCIKYGYNFNVRDNSGETAFSMAKKMHRTWEGTQFLAQYLGQGPY